jgi:cytochrome b subunit of formate dehydrogenase
VAARNVSAQVCSPCHTSVRLTQKYGIASDRFTTFNDSYHGLALKGGSIEVANCASCHGSHTIRAAKDSSSSIHPANLAVTCGRCHKGANERFAIGKVHVSVARSEEDQSLYWISTIYIILIISIVGGMFVHNLADFIRKSYRKILIRRGVIAEHHVGHHLYLRMTLSERLQHGALLVSFVALVITGFMLRYPDAWWVRSIRSLSSDVFDLRSLIHRVAAVVMVAASLFHLYYVSFTERGKALLRDLMPKIQDVRDAIAVMKFNFGFSKTKPQFGRFSYIEKSEYWALVWGTVVMAVTGFIMWFDNTFIGLFTKLGYDIARLVHFYEAWLATLSIIVWHFYYVIFNPDVYPINLAFWTGTITEAEMAEEHPLELAEIRKKELAEDIIEVSSNDGTPKKPAEPTRPKEA